MAQVPEEIKIPVPWGHISGKWWGPKDTQPVLAIHGWQDNAGSFDKLVPLLPQHIAVLCIDLPGHGFSSPFPKGQFYFLYWDGVMVVRHIVKHFNWNKISIIGHSLGGAIGFMYAATYPEDTEKLLCIDVASPAFAEKGDMIKMLGRGIDKFLKYEKYTENTMPCYSYEHMQNILLQGHNGSLTVESSEIMMKRGVRYNSFTDQYTFTRDVRLLSIVPVMSLDEALEYASNISCQVLNIKAKPGPKYRRHDFYDKVLGKLKNTAKRFEFYEVNGTHHLHLNNPLDIVTYLTNFLET